MDNHLTVNSAKSLALPIGGISPEVGGWFREQNFKMVDGGMVILGSPIGTRRFRLDHVEKEVETVLFLLGKIEQCDTLGKLNLRWASTQGLYQLIRDCANQLLRHLLRTVSPSIIVPALEIVDSKTCEVLGRLLDFVGEELSENVQTRFGLPMGLAG